MEFTNIGLTLGAPATSRVGDFCDFVEKRLAPAGVRFLVLLVRYRYQFPSHPECAGRDPLSAADARQITEACRRAGIHLIPKMNLLGHQSECKGDNSPENTTALYDGLLAAHPELDETPDAPFVRYCRSLCPSHPEAKRLVFDLMDDLVAAFAADTLHIGCDEVFELGECPRCKGTPNYRLFADWVTALHDHLAEKHIATMMWGDRLLLAEENNNHEWEASRNDTSRALDLIPEDIILCDWHYETFPTYPSIDIFTGHGFRVIPSFFWREESAEAFLRYAKEHGGDRIIGVMLTTWCPSEMLMDALDGKKAPLEWVEKVAETARHLLKI